MPRLPFPKCWGPPTVGIKPVLQTETRARARAAALYGNYNLNIGLNKGQWNASVVPRPVGRSSGRDPIPRNPRRSLGRNPFMVTKITIPQPFSFAEREAAFLRRKQDRLCAEALPQPLSSRLRRKSIPKQRGNPVSKPFLLKTSERGARHAEEFKSKIAQLESNRLELVNFHSKRPAICQKPFEPVRSMKSLVNPVQFQFRSDQRAQERELFNKSVKQKEELKEFEQKQAAARRVELEKTEKLKFRRNCCFRANPIPVHRAFQIRPSAQPLTVPMSPAFTSLPSMRRRIQRNQHQNQAA